MAGPFDFLTGGSSSPSGVNGFNAMDVLGIGSNARSQLRGFQNERATHARGQGEARDVEMHKQALMQDFAKFTKENPDLPFQKAVTSYINTAQGAHYLTQRGVGPEAVGDLKTIFTNPDNENMTLQSGQKVVGPQTAGADGKPTRDTVVDNPAAEGVEKELVNRALAGDKQAAGMLREKWRFDAQKNAIGNLLQQSLDAQGKPAPAGVGADGGAPEQGGVQPGQQAPQAPQGAAPGPQGAAPAPQLQAFPDEQTARAAVAKDPSLAGQQIMVGGKKVTVNVAKAGAKKGPSAAKVPTGK